MILIFLTTTIGCNSSSDDYDRTHQGQFLDAPVRGLDYVCGTEYGMTDDDGMFTFERNQMITFSLGSIQIGETVPVVTDLELGTTLPDIYIFTPRMLVPSAENNRDPILTNILRFLHTLDEDYDPSDGIDNAANGIYISDSVRNSAESINAVLDFTMDEVAFEVEAEELIATLTGEYRPLIPGITAQHHFMAQLVRNKIDDALNRYATPGVTLSLETPCPCERTDDACITAGELDGIARYNDENHAYIWDFAGGYADVENERPMAVDTRFRIGSLTKSFVSITILKLMEQGILHYNDLASAYLPEPVQSIFNTVMDMPSPLGPEYPTYAEAITLARLMNHSAGMPNFYTVPSEWFLDFLFHPEKEQNFEALVETEIRKGPLFYPETGWSYSNSGYAMLGLILKTVMGKPWEDVIHEQIINPFGLTDTLVPKTGEASILGPYSNDQAPTDNYAYGYMSLYGLTEGVYGDKTDPMIKRDIQDPSYVVSAGNMIGTAPDLRKWITLIANTGSEKGMFGPDFDWLHDETHYSDLFFPLAEYLDVGANVYINKANQRYVISGNSTGYDVNATYDAAYQIAAGACANRTYDASSLPNYDGPDIWNFDDTQHVQIKDVLVFDAIDIFIK